MTEFKTHISTSGGLLSAAFIESIRELGTRQRGIEPESFALLWRPAPKSPAALEDEIATAWELLIERWDAVRADLPMMEVSQVRDRWLLPLSRLLDFEPIYLRGDTTLDEDGKLRFPLSHRGWDGPGAPVIHTVFPSQNLDGRSERGRGVKAKSPHDMLQAFLNASQPDEWAMLSNGILLRLLRDYHHTFTKGYVQFDLESMFETRNYGDFRGLYRMCHASRFLAPKTSEVSPLEQFYKDSLATGVKVGEDLRAQVREAIETLGNGFLDGELIERLQGDQELCHRYWSEILHIIYRILFLLFAEQRGMLPSIGAPLESLYRSQYSITALRGHAEGDIPREDDFTDLWQGLKATFRMVREGAQELGVFAYDGMLFEDLDTLAQQEAQESVLSGRACRNSALLRAIRSLTLIEREGVLQRISYADLGVEELGSIYESLLDFHPRVSKAAETINGREVAANSFFLDPRGAGRKTTGSYYTHPSLVNQLIKTALLPVMHDRLAQAGLPVVEEEAIGEATAGLVHDYDGLTPEERMAGEQALLDIKVCDPAAGSGHFLVKANDALGAELARVRTGDEYPTEDQVQFAKREILTNCIYAVDLNPMAVELCKVSLWINASVSDAPLSFLDHRIKCGNSLIGSTPELMAEGIPTDAFRAVTADDRATVNSVRKRNREELAGQLPLQWRVTVMETMEDLERWRRLALLADESPKAARDAYENYRTSSEYPVRKLEGDFWTAAFFWPLPAGTDWVPTHSEFTRLLSEGPLTLPPEALDAVEGLAEQHSFFHWHLEFPEVFAEDGHGGFDCVLGNPPWERIKLQEMEFFAPRDPEIASAPNAAARRKLITKLPKEDPALAAEYEAALRKSECLSEFLRNCGRYPLTGVGDVNTYAVFTGLARSVIDASGRVGMVIPSGIATDYTYRDFFADVMGTRSLCSLYDFENGQGLFPGTHRSYKFSLLTLAGEETPDAKFGFFLLTVDDLGDEERTFTLGQQDLALINPNTRTCPVFRTRRDAELTRQIYRHYPVLLSEGPPQVNPWAVSFLRMFDMANDSGHFRVRDDLEAKGLSIAGNRLIGEGRRYLPLYEGRMVHLFDHRTSSVGVRIGFRSGVTIETQPEEYADPNYLPMPRYWVSEGLVAERVPREYCFKWYIGFRDVTSPTNERTAVCAILPYSGVGHKVPLLLTIQDAPRVCALFGNLCSMALDYITRQKLGGVSLTFFIVKQLPILPPDCYTVQLLDFIVPRVSELTYTAWDIKTFADEVWRAGDESLPGAIIRQWEANVAQTGGHVGAEPPSWVQLAPDGFPHPPFKWDEERRARLRAELDALYAHLYRLTREELDYILDTFPIVRRKDQQKYGEYRTKRMVLEQYEELAGRFD